MNRRLFFEKIISLSTFLSLHPVLNKLLGKDYTMKKIPRRKLGKNDDFLSVLGFGGILVMNETPGTAANYVSEAYDLGINYFDVAPTYGNAEERLGPALEPYRKNVFLACKTTQRTAKEAERELHESFEKLKTDYFDLYQLHAITTEEDIETAFGKNGAMETFIQAKKEGKVKYLGFSAHSEYAALKAMELYDFDTILFPVNFICWQNGNFGPKVINEALKRNMGILALKALALSKVPKGEEKPYKKMWYQPIENNNIASLSLRFTLSQHATAAIPPGDWRFWKTAYTLASQNMTELNEDELSELFSYAAGHEPIFSA